jgi:hypothetical protein
MRRFEAELTAAGPTGYPDSAGDEPTMRGRVATPERGATPASSYARALGAAR